MFSAHAQAVELPKVGVSLPKGTPVVILLQAMHMHPDYWDEPEAFDPGRWIRAEDTSAMRTASDNGTRSAFIPFLVSPKLFAQSLPSLVVVRWVGFGCGCAGWPAAVCGSVPGGAGVRRRAARPPPGTPPTPTHALSSSWRLLCLLSCAKA